VTIKKREMEKIKLRWLFVILTFIAKNNLFCQDKVAEIDKMMQYASDNSLFSGVIMVADKGKVIYNKGFGYADIENKKSIDENTLFNLCSITKQFTAMGIMILKEQGKLLYDDKLIKYFPNLPYPNVTLRQILNHTSGLPDYLDMLYKGWTDSKIPTNSDAIAMLEKNKPALLFTPGDKHQYCNTGYMLLASLIEKVSGLSYADFLSRNIFQKTGMTHTLVYSPVLSKTTPGNLALPYTFDYAKGKAVLTVNFEPYHRQVTVLDGTYGDGGIHSTANDMIKWDNALKSELLVKKATLGEAFTNGILNDGKPIAAPNGYGFGWFILNDPLHGKYVHHTGGWPGFRQAFIRYLDKERTLLVLRNNEVAFSSIQKAIENILDGKPYIMPQTGMAYALVATALKGSAEDVRNKFKEIRNSIIIIKEEVINLAGYGVMEQGKLLQALEIMKINAELFPNSWNAFDSLGELYLKNGDKENAKLNYKKSLEINPQNDNAKKALESL
jgi:CubicO group peptidase (beta-lactamase class C family)